MNRGIIAAMTAFMMVMPWTGWAQAQGETGNQSGQAGRGQPPPIAQPLVREGDLAMDLMAVLGLGPAQSEAHAESALASLGIAPRNGWISDYPVTPDVFGEIWDSVGAAADAGRLAMSREEAHRAVTSMSQEDGLPVATRAQADYSAESAPPDYGGYPEYGEMMPPASVEEYYHASGPPVVTYYPPPWDYYYLYSWVPSPFWWAGWWLPGFFVLHDFHVYVGDHHHHHHGHHHHRGHHGRGDGDPRPGDVRRVVSNRTVDRGTNTVRRIDPARRATEGMGTRGVASRGTLEAPGAREGAQSILRRSTETGVSRSDVPRYSPSGRVTPRLASQGAGNRPGTTVEGQGGPAGGVDNVRVRGATPGSSRDRVPSLGNNRTGGPSASPGRPQGMTGESPGRAGDPRTSGFARPAGVVPGQAMGRAQRPERVRPAVDSGTGGFATARPGRDMGPFQGRSGRAGDAGMGFHRSPRSGGAAGFSGMPRGGGGSMGAPSPRGGASLGGGPRGGGGPGPGSGPQGGGRGGGGGGRGGMRS